MKVLHDQAIQQITFLDERFYLDEKTKTYHPSVTTILDVYPKGFGFYQWLKDVGSNSEEIVKRAGEEGTNVHNAIEGFLDGEELQWVNGEKENYNLIEWKMILKFYDFYKTFKPETIAVEVSLVDPELGYGGTLDYICKINNEVWYIDWKSSNYIQKTHKIQATAYQKLWNKLTDIKIDRMGCMHLKASTRGADKSGKNIQGEGWKLIEVDEPERLLGLFNHSFALWKEEHPNPKPKNLVYPDRISIKKLKETDTV